MQYQNMAGSAGTHNCAVCHTVPMNPNGHHRNMVNRKDQVAIVQEETEGCLKKQPSC